MKKIYSLNGNVWMNYRDPQAEALKKSLNTLYRDLQTSKEEDKLQLINQISDLKHQIEELEIPTPEDLLIVQNLFNSKMPIQEEDDNFSLCSAMCTLSEIDGNSITIAYMHNGIYNII